MFNKKVWLVFWEMMGDFLINFDEVTNLNPNAVVELVYQLEKFGMNETIKSYTEVLVESECSFL